MVEAADNKALLEVCGVTQRFGGLVAVNDVSFDVRRGQIFGLIGPNGAGKTTLFNAITGITPPSQGELRFEGHNLKGQGPHQVAKRGIARTFQNIRLFGNLAVLENVMIARHLHSHSGVVSGVLGLPGAAREEADTRSRAMELLELVGLDGQAYEKARSLAYGDQRRLEIARALALEPKLLLLDEPAAGMNPQEKVDLAAFVRQICKRYALTVLLIEHHVPLVMGLCDEIAVLDFGHLIARGAPEQVRHDPAVIGAYLGDLA